MGFCLQMQVTEWSFVKQPVRIEDVFSVPSLAGKVNSTRLVRDPQLNRQTVNKRNYTKWTETFLPESTEPIQLYSKQDQWHIIPSTCHFRKVSNYNNIQYTENELQSIIPSEYMVGQNLWKLQ